MDTVQDFEDLLELFERCGVRYLVIGGLAFILGAGVCSRLDSIRQWIAESS